MSRVVSGLTRRKLVLRAADADDARGVRLALSKSGRRLYEGLIGAAEERDQALRNCLSTQEKQVFERALTKLAGRARDFIQQEKQ
jgi:DNA-binding MarR family transcriptional regulator